MGSILADNGVGLANIERGGSVTRFSAPDSLGTGDADFRSWSREPVPGVPSVMRNSAPEGRRPSGPGTGSSVRCLNGGGSVMRNSAPDPLGAGDADFRSWSREPTPGAPSVMRNSAPEGRRPSGPGAGSSVPKPASNLEDSRFPFTDSVPLNKLDTITSAEDSCKRFIAAAVGRAYLEEWIFSDAKNTDELG